MKKIFLLCLLILCCASTALAAPVWGNGGYGGGGMLRQMQRVAVLYENNSGTKYNATLDKPLLNNINDTLFQLGDQSMDGTEYVAELHKRGIERIAEASPAEIFALFNNTQADYVLYIEVPVPTIHEEDARFASDITATFKLPVRFFSIKDRTELYNEVIWVTKTHNSIGGGASQKNVMAAALAEANPTIKELLLKYLK